MERRMIDKILDSKLKCDYLMTSMLHHGTFVAANVAFYLSGMHESGAAEYLLRTAAIAYPISLATAYFMKVLTVAVRIDKWYCTAAKIKGKELKDPRERFYGIAWAFAATDQYFLAVLAEAIAIFGCKNMVALISDHPAYFTWGVMILKMIGLLITYRHYSQIYRQFDEDFDEAVKQRMEGKRA